jgi:hypothetical protein
MLYVKGIHIFQKSRSNLKILGDRRVTWNKIQIADPRKLGATVKKLVIIATRSSRIFHLCSIIRFIIIPMDMTDSESLVVLMLSWALLGRSEIHHVRY